MERPRTKLVVLAFGLFTAAVIAFAVTVEKVILETASNDGPSHTPGPLDGATR